MPLPAASTADANLENRAPQGRRVTISRAEIIDAALKLLGPHRSVSSLSLREVAREAGLSHGLVNFHFQSKENLLVETLLYLAEEYRLNWTSALEAAEAPALLPSATAAERPKVPIMAPAPKCEGAKPPGTKPATASS